MNFQTPADNPESAVSNHLAGFREVVQHHLSAVTAQRKNHPDAERYFISEEMRLNLEQMFEKLRNVATQSGFSIRPASVEEMRNLLERLRIPIQHRRTDTFSALLNILDNIEQSFGVLDDNQ